MKPRCRIMLMSILTAVLTATTSFCGTVIEDFEPYAAGEAAYKENGWTTVNAEGSQNALIASVESVFSSDSQSLHYTDFDAGSLYDLRIQKPLSESLTNGVFCFDFRVDQPADNFRVERVGQYVSYYRNENLIYVSQNLCIESNQVVDCFIYNEGGELEKVWVWAEELIY